MSAVGSTALVVAADVDGDGDPDCEEQTPVNEFEGEGEVVVGFGTVAHAGGEDPD